jgi:phage terminase small subunit
MAAPLTAKRQRFVEEYLIDLNATAAAGRAGYKHPNKQGPRLLVNVGIAAAKQARSQRAQVDQDYVLCRLKIEAEREGDQPGHILARVQALKLLGEHLGLFGDVATVRKVLELERKEDARDGAACCSGEACADRSPPGVANGGNGRQPPGLSSVAAVGLSDSGPGSGYPAGCRRIGFR